MNRKKKKQFFKKYLLRNHVSMELRLCRKAYHLSHDYRFCVSNENYLFGLVAMTTKVSD